MRSDPDPHRELALTGDADGQVSVGNELPGANGGDQAPAPKDATNKNEETTNYEISRVTKTEVAEGGRIKRLSVAVVVDGVYATAPDGKPTYQPRPQAEIERIAALVRSAVGFDKARGDQVEVVNLRFAEAPSRAAIHRAVADRSRCCRPDQGGRAARSSSSACWRS